MDEVTVKIKRLIISFGNEIWNVDPLPFARMRAEYYAKSDLDSGEITQDEYEALIQDEIEHALTDNYDLIDYMKNNLKWSEILPHAKKVGQVDETLYAQWYNNAKITIVRQ